MSHRCDERYTIYDERFPKARIEHRCEACKELIRVGDRYAKVGIVFDREAETVKRCLRCQTIHEHLRTLGEDDGMWPDEQLDCGESYRDHWDKEPPPEVAALAFWRPGDALP